MAERCEFIFKIIEVAPEQLPASKLAAYVKDLSALFGEEDIHLVNISKESTNLVFDMDAETAAVVRQRLTLVGSAEAPDDVSSPFASVDARLKRDQWSASVVDDTQSKVAEFPGVRAANIVLYPSLIQPASLEGIPIRIGGKEQMVPVHLQDGDAFHYCIARRDIAAEIAEALFTKFVRVHGEARWKRTMDGEWVRYRFMINTFEPLEDEPLMAVVARLRTVSGSGWEKVKNAATELSNLRGDS
jgi:hypothetical protein